MVHIRMVSIVHNLVKKSYHSSWPSPRVLTQSWPSLERALTIVMVQPWRSTKGHGSSRESHHSHDPYRKHCQQSRPSSKEPWLSPDDSNQERPSRRELHKSRLSSKHCKQVTTRPKKDKSITIQIREQ